MKDNIFDLPKCRKNDAIEEFVNITLEEYLCFLKNLNNAALFKADYTKDMLVKDVEVLNEGILDAIRLYLIGLHHKAYESFKKALDKVALDSKIELGFSTYGRCFYRMRNDVKENDPQINTLLMHIPYNLCHKVNMERFSIAGSPGLYIASNLYTCIKEINIPKNKLDRSYASRLELISNLKLFDLRIRDGYENNIAYLLAFPLIFACSLKVSDTKENFKPEYIIPNLTMQWVRELESDKFFGIAYSSSKINKNVVDNPKFFYNVVIPSRFPDQKKHRYCDMIVNSIKMTMPICCDKYIKEKSAKVSEPNLDIFENNKEHKLTYLKKEKMIYKNSSFAKIEDELHKLNTSSPQI